LIRDINGLSLSFMALVSAMLRQEDR
jgi:hypothetical protein